MTALQIRITCALLLALSAAACDAAPEPEAAPASAPAVAEAAPALNAKAPAEPAAPALPAAPTPPAAKPFPLCDVLCTRTASLNCGPVDACKAGCQEMAEIGICNSELRAMLECVSAQPVERFECDPETRAPAIREGHCDDEQKAVAECVSKQAPSAP